MTVDLYKFMSPQMLILKVVGCWPWGEKYKWAFEVFHWFITVCMVIYNGSIIIEGFRNFDDFYVLSQALHIVSGCLPVIVKSMILQWNYKTILKIVNMLQLKEFQARTDEHIKIFKEAAFAAKSLFNVYFYGVTVFYIMYCWTPIINSARRLPTPAWFPFDALLDEFYIPIYVFQCFTFFFPCYTVVAMDTLFAVLMTLVGAQCDLLCTNISKSSGNLQDCIYHHWLILKFSKKVDQVFGTIVMVQFPFCISVLCLTLLTLSLCPLFSVEFFAEVVGLFLVFSQLFLYCWFGNEATFKSAQVFDALYNSEWYDHPQEVKRNLLMFMQKTQRPVVFTAANIFPINLVIYTRIVRSSWGYFMALYQLQNKK